MVKQLSRVAAFVFVIVFAVSTGSRGQGVGAGPAAEAEQDEQSAGEGQLVRDVRTDLVKEQFDTLDRTAEGFRRSKARWAGGGWKLRTLYEALDAPHQTDPDMVAHLEHLRHWMTARPESMTARVALATSLTRWAWIARGNGTADKVTADGWQLFGQRIQEAETVLAGSQNMKTMDPQWYSEEMVVGLAQGWDEKRVREVFERGVQFEPEYQYFYKARAGYLLPKWYGKPNDATDFAKAAADHVGGEMGDYLYWEIATVIIKRGNGNLDPFVAQMDWARIQRGYQTLQSQFQLNRRERNELAFMAYKFKDKGVAEQQFASIGQEWSRGVWRERNFFEKARDWAGGHESWP
jgi:hypothetical protein